MQDKILAEIYKKPDAFTSGFFGGRRWIRTTEVVDNRFTVCPLWPLGYSPDKKWYWWAFRDLNPGPTGYEPAALTD